MSKRSLRSKIWLTDHWLNMVDVYGTHMADNVRKMKMVQRRFEIWLKTKEQCQPNEISAAVAYSFWAKSPSRVHYDVSNRERLSSHPHTHTHTHLLITTKHVRGYNTSYLVPFSRSSVFQNSFPDSIRNWNGLSQQTRGSPSLDTFRKRMAKYV